MQYFDNWTQGPMDWIDVYYNRPSVTEWIPMNADKMVHGYLTTTKHNKEPAVSTCILF